MATAAGSPLTTPEARTGAGADATSTILAAAAAATPTDATTSKTTPETAAVTSSTTMAGPTQQTIQTSTPLTAHTSPSSSHADFAVSTVPAVKSDLVTSPSTSSSDTAVSQVSFSQPATTAASSQVLLSLTPSTKPAGVTSSPLMTAAVATTSNGLSTGAVAGIAVGCAVAGLVIGMLMAFLLLKRRTKSHSEPELVDTRAEGKSFDSRALTASPVEPLSTVSDLDQFLLAPKPDRELAGELQSLGHLIQQHVEDNYHLFPVKQSIGSLGQALAELGLVVDGKTPSGTAKLAEMAANPLTRHVALQHVISRVIFDSLAAKSTSRLSMLPLAVSSLVREMPPCEKHLGSPQGQTPSKQRMDCSEANYVSSYISSTHALAPDIRLPAES